MKVNNGLGRVRWLVLALLSAGSFSLSPVVAQSSIIDQLNQAAQQNRQLQQQQKQRIQALNQDLSNLDAATQGQLDQLRKLEAETSRLEQERADLTDQINLLEKQQKETEAKIQSLETELTGLKERLSVMLQSLQREKAGRYLPLLRAQSFTDLAVRARWVSTLGEHQTDLVDRITSTVRSLNEEKFRFQQLVDDLSRTRAERETRIKALKQNQQSVNQTVASLRTQRAGRAVLLRESLVAQDQLRQQLSGIQGRISAEVKRIAEERARRLAELKRQQQLAAQREAARKAEAARIARIKAQQERQRQQQALEAQRRKDQEAQQKAQDAVKELPAVAANLSGPMLFPMRGGRIAEGFGADGNNWQTIEGAGASSQVIASADGRVIESFYYPNLGWIIIIQHSERITSTYINILEPRVSAGQAVNQGQLIGFTGGGALLPNNQLRFQVGVLSAGGDLVYVDPSRYY